MRRAVGLITAIVLGSYAFVLHAPIARADTPSPIHIAIPVDVTINVGSHFVVFISRPTSTSPVNCVPGTPWPQTVVAVDPGGGIAAQITGVLAFHDQGAHAIPNGARYRITSGGTSCTSELTVYTGTLE